MPRPGKTRFFVLWAAALAALLAAMSRAAEEPVELQDLVVKPGDTLWSISHHFLKDPRRWDEILKHNRLPSKDPTVALPGMILRVPSLLIKEELRAARLVRKKNNVLFRRRDTAEWKPAVEQMQLFRDDGLRTLEDSLARVNFIDQGVLQVDANSLALIRPVKKDYDVFLRSGGVWVGRAKVVTVSARITPRTPDTTYSARVKPDLSTVVEVYRGRATVESQNKKVDVESGMMTVVKLGGTPAEPVRVPDLPDFEARAAEFTGDFRPVRETAGIDGGPGADAGGGPGAAAGGGNLEDIYVDITNISIGQPLLGYRVQFAAEREFDPVLWDRSYDLEEHITVKDVSLPPGRYWVRLAPIDLLGTTGAFKKPKLYALGAVRLAAIAEKASLRILRPGNDDEVVPESRYKVVGKAASNLSIMVNGRTARVDPQGNFKVDISLSPGPNTIRVTTIDDNGNTEIVQRTVTYRGR